MSGAIDPTKSINRTETRVKNISEICALKDIKHAVVSPGSRNALLTVYFARHPDIETHIVVDERSAAYIALGIAQQTQKPAVLICTSGTAALNYGPGIAEAFYLGIPLIVITADRPPEWIDQQDGQAIQQTNLYTAHCKKSFSLPLDTDILDVAWHFDRLVGEAINLANSGRKGPVHLNVPIREPFYDELSSSSIQAAQAYPLKLIDEPTPELTFDSAVWDELATTVGQATKLLVLSGQNRYSKSLCDEVDDFVLRSNGVCIGDILSNMAESKAAYNHIDAILPFIGKRDTLKFTPDLLITFGQSVLSKNLKSFLRQGVIKNHWHLQPNDTVADTFQSLTKIIRIEPAFFFKEITERINDATCSNSFKNIWQKLESDSVRINKSFLTNDADFGEFHAVSLILRSLPEGGVLHLGNSMSVRYASLLGISGSLIEVFCNRGTAGIDGSLSTAVGHAISGKQVHTLVLGDLSFFYDRNGLWTESLPSNLRIILLNNQGGGIFKLINGPDQLPELDRFFVTEHCLSGANTAREMNMEYYCCSDEEELTSTLKSFYDVSDKAKLIEIKTDKSINTKLFQKYKSCFAQGAE